MMQRTSLLVAVTASVLSCASPTLAQENGPQYSTPAEQAQTRALNESAISGTAQSPATLNGEAQSAQPDADSNYRQDDAYPQQGGGDQSSGYPAQYQGPPPNEDQYPSGGQMYGPYPQQGDQSSGYPAQYQGPPPNEDQYPPSGAGNGSPRQPAAGEQQYQQQQSYQGQRAQYENDNARYRAELHAYDRTMYDWSYPAPIAYRYDGGQLEPVAMVETPRVLYDMPVEGQSGRWVGRVKGVRMSYDGHPMSIEVALNRRVTVWVDPGDLRYDPEDRVLFTDLSREDLWQMPDATVTPNAM